MPGSIREYLKAKPFRPFRLHMASGGTFDIRHPELLKAGRSDMVLFTPSEDDIEVYDHWSTVSMMLVERMSHLDAPAHRSN